MGERFYSLLLWLYPESFRSRFEHQMLEVFRKQRVDSKYAGPFGGVRFWWDMVWDLLVSIHHPFAQPGPVVAVGRDDNPLLT